MVVSAATSAPTSTATPKPQAENSGFSGGDFETFLKMLTTQIRNQDPLNPMEGSDFAVQLATFSGVEQQVQTNDLLQRMNEQLGADSLSSYSEWIGRKVRTTGQVYLGQDPLIMNVTPDPTADRVVLVTKDSYGRRVSSEEIGKGSGLVEWYGVDENGQPFPNGLYSFTLESYRGDDLIATNEVASYSTVQEVQRNSGKITFMLDGGATASLSQIDALAAKSD
ncbi:flagellar hook capping FlgD N-terminal domain-containing protein [Paracoccus xiamenensis]|uniref:flagellar hook capping FlgD N-terminal domain-containing protein n=1 Tax=Paracoccus xiamenensis TaxID=2714901 RepID=UPI00140DAC55|nr:flagellar hook capping FlgD N-terminal domain-containing protein [Paracoccus xiamenensis]NHF73153.1 flagellar basal body rod modification protein [Paracoccus xiamenensis]